MKKFVAVVVVVWMPKATKNGDKQANKQNLKLVKVETLQQIFLNNKEKLFSYTK